jgi:hypothetical protein
MKSLLFGTTGTINLVTTGTKYGLPWGYHGLASGWVNEFLIPSPGKFRKLYVKVAVAPGVGASWEFTLMKGATATDLKVTISGDSQTYAQDITNEFAISPAEIAAGANGISIRVVPTNSPVACTATWGFEFEGDNSAESVHGSGNFGNLSTTAQQFLLLNGASAFDAANEFRAQFVAPCAGTLKNLCVRLSAAPGVDKSRTFTVRKQTPPGASADTAVTVTISGTNTYGTSGAASVAVAAGDLICISSTMNPTDGTVAGAQIKTGLTFVADTDGEFMVLMSNRNQSPSRTDLNYCLLHGANTLWTATVTNVSQVAALNFRVKALYIDIVTAPGAGKSYSFSLNKDGSNVAATNTLVQDTANAGHVDSLAVDIVAGERLAFAVQGSGTPNWANTSCSLCGAIESGGTLKQMGGML